MKNDVEFRMYRKFGADTSIKFDTPEPLPEEKVKAGQPPERPYPSVGSFAVASMPALPPQNCWYEAWSRWSTGPEDSSRSCP